ncbi:MAG: hypothetical protein WAV46_00600 [Candidatus Moraniibacteriota bacterium]
MYNREDGQGERAAFASLHARILSTEEKSTMRQALQAAVSRSQSAALRPERQPVGFFSFFFGRTFAVSALSLVLVVGGGFGVARAAEQSLPGQPLYPMKTQFNEPLVASLKNSDAARIEWEHQLVQRRMAEAETLAEAGKLGDNEKHDIERQLSVHRKTLEQLKGRSITDDEFVPAQLETESKKIQVRFEYQENKASLHIEEKNTESKRDDEKGNGESSVHRERQDSSMEKRTDAEVRSQKREGEETKSRSKTEADGRSGLEQKVDQKNGTLGSVQSENAV